jgi:hypothetical protein
LDIFLFAELKERILKAVSMKISKWNRFTRG